MVQQIVQPHVPVIVRVCCLFRPPSSLMRVSIRVLHGYAEGTMRNVTGNARVVLCRLLLVKHLSGSG